MDIKILQGKTFHMTYRWESPDIVWRPIQGVFAEAPVRIDCAGHGVPNGWRVAIESVRGMTQINTQNSPPRARDYSVATVVDPDKIEINAINASSYREYAGGGYLRYNKPVDLTGVSGRAKIKDRIGGSVLASTEAGDAPLNTMAIVVDPAAKKIDWMISASDTAEITWRSGVYEIEMVMPGGVVSLLVTGGVSVVPEVSY